MMTPDYFLGYSVATASDSVLQAALSDRPVTLALLRQLNTLLPRELDAFLNPVSRSNSTLDK